MWDLQNHFQKSENLSMKVKFHSFKELNAVLPVIFDIFSIQLHKNTDPLGTVL